MNKQLKIKRDFLKSENTLYGIIGFNIAIILTIINSFNQRNDLLPMILSALAIPMLICGVLILKYLNKDLLKIKATWGKIDIITLLIVPICCTILSFAELLFNFNEIVGYVFLFSMIISIIIEKIILLNETKYR